MDRGKEHWKLVGKLINYANRLASPQDFWGVIHLRSVGLLTATNILFGLFHERENVLIFWVWSGYLLFINPCNAWVQEELLHSKVSGFSPAHSPALTAIRSPVCTTVNTQFRRHNIQQNVQVEYRNVNIISEWFIISLVVKIKIYSLCLTVY